MDFVETLELATNIYSADGWILHREKDEDGNVHFSAWLVNSEGEHLAPPEVAVRSSPDEAADDVLNYVTPF